MIRYSVVRMASQVLILLLAIVATAASAMEAVRVGSFLALSGPAAYLGQPELKTLQLYIDKLNAEGSLDKAKTDELTAYYRKLLDEGQCTVEQWRPMTEHSVDWSPYLGHEWNDDYDKEISLEKLKELAEKISTIPAEHKVHNRVKKIYDDRVKMASGEKLLDWGMAENLAYASIVDLGKRVRITGQDSGRGTFFHRHAVLHLSLIHI